VFYGRGYTNPAATAPARQTAAKPVQPVQELKKALAPKPIQQPIAVRPVQPKQQKTSQDITKPIYDAGVGASQWWTQNAARPSPGRSTRSLTSAPGQSTR